MSKSPSLSERLAFKDWLVLERLALSTAKKYAKNWAKERYSEWFGGKYRIYLELPAEAQKKAAIVPADLEEILTYLGYEVVDYGAGTAKRSGASDKDRRVLKIGSVLQQAAKKTQDSRFKTKVEKELKNFQSDPQRSGKKTSAMVVLSRHPYDIAGMSTDRGWTSCMNLHHGTFRHICAYDVKEGTIVAYLVNKEDKNINHPIGRIAIKPFISDEGQVYLVPEPKVYGTDMPGFAEVVQDWLDEKQKGIFGKFTIHPDLYQDSKKNSIIIRNLDELKKSVRELRDGLSLEILGQQLSAEAKFQDAVIGWNKVTQSLKFYDGEWLAGDFSGQIIGGTFSGGIIQKAEFLSGTVDGATIVLKEVYFHPDAKWISGKVEVVVGSKYFTIPTKLHPQEAGAIVNYHKSDATQKLRTLSSAQTELNSDLKEDFKSTTDELTAEYEKQIAPFKKKYDQDLTELLAQQELKFEKRLEDLIKDGMSWSERQKIVNAESDKMDEETANLKHPLLVQFLKDTQDFRSEYEVKMDDVKVIYDVESTKLYSEWVEKESDLHTNVEKLLKKDLAYTDFAKWKEDHEL